MKALTPDQLSTIEQKDAENLLKRLAEGKPLTTAQWERLRGEPQAQAELKQKDIAKKYSVTSRTVRNWEDEGAPINDPKALAEWLALRKNVAPALVAGLPTDPNAKKKRKTKSKNVAGASEALRRLEAEEVASYDSLQDAMASEDPLRARSARDAWLKTSDSLRRFDLIVADWRRSSGELIPREQALKIVERFAYASRIAFVQFAHNAAPILASQTNPHDCLTTLDRLHREVWLSTMEKLLGGELQDWAKDAIRKEVAQAFEAGAK